MPSRPVLFSLGLWLWSFSCNAPTASRPIVAAEAEPLDTTPAIVRKYDDQGIRLPAEALPLGTPVPIGIAQVSTGAGWVRLSGTVKPDEVIDFYRKYLTLPDGTAPHEVGRSTLFRNAHPKQPGNTGRVVEVRVIPEQRGSRTAVLILDQDYADRATQEELEGIKNITPEDWKPSSIGEIPPEELL